MNLLEYNRYYFLLMFRPATILMPSSECLVDFSLPLHFTYYWLRKFRPYVTSRTRCESLHRVADNIKHDDNDNVCNRTIDELLDCMRSSVTDSCGDVAGRWLFMFKSLIMLPVQHHLGCSSSLTGVFFVIYAVASWNFVRVR